MKKINFRKGSGTAIIGLYIMLFCMTMGIMFMGIYQRNEYKQEMQTAADTIADGVALYQAANGGSYQDAKNEMKRLEILTKKYTGVDYKTLELNKSELEEKHTADITATVYLRDVYTKYNYQVASNAATEYREPYNVNDAAYIQRDVTSIYLNTDPNDPNAEQKIILATDLAGYDLNNNGEIAEEELRTSLESFDGTKFKYMKYGAEGDWEVLNAENLNKHYMNSGYVEWAVAIANDDSHGYDQGSRTMNPDCDCSSLVYYALINNGYRIPGRHYPFTTHDMPSELTRSGFVELPFSLSTAKAGDILWKNGHTAICIGPGMEVAAHISENGTIYGSISGDQTTKEVCTGPIRAAYTHIFRPK